MATAVADPPPPLAGFDHVKRFRDPKLGRVAAKILPGEYYVTDDDEVITTVLGSCVAACVWDPVAGIGGMNHFMIPGVDGRHDGDGDGGSAGGDGGRPFAPSARYGIFAMELLVNAILTHGGQRSRLLVKVVGGGHMMPFATRIGDDNIAFARSYLATERFTVVGEHVGGRHARRVAFHPLTGRARVLEIGATHDRSVRRQERAYADRIPPLGPATRIEIF